jgi:hypothetical protein
MNTQTRTLGKMVERLLCGTCFYQYKSPMGLGEGGKGKEDEGASAKSRNITPGQAENRSTHT